MNAALQKLRSWLRSTWRRARAPERVDTVIVPPAPPPAIALPSPLLACATVVIPALNEAARVADVVRHALADPATAEVIVVDDSSIDDTARLARQAGAEVITSTMLGKGASMRDATVWARPGAN
jgi:cellulose synthase/poly-beta-1,6-N-acetylglucosamine synthase-like glycosyltransferase